MRTVVLPQLGFARQLEHVATTAAFSSKLRTLESQVTASQASHKAGWCRVRESVLIAKRATMAFALAAAFLQYYVLDVKLQIMTMRPVALEAVKGI
jgi:hypothetical protein